MTPDTEGLHAIANTEISDRVADIVFVHGLGGSSHATWRHGRENENDHFFWPKELGKELPQCGVWSFGYAAGFTQFGNPGMIIAKRAGNLAQQLTLAESVSGVNAGIGTRPLIFIMHSMGGLVVKSLITASAHGSPEQQRLVAQIRGLVFCGTPHRGSALASAAKVLSEHADSITRLLAPWLGWVGGGLVSRLIRPQAHLREMVAHAEPLDLLHDHFLSWQRGTGVPVKTYAESHDLMAGGFLGRLISLGKVVPRDSANTVMGSFKKVKATSPQKRAYFDPPMKTYTIHPRTQPLAPRASLNTKPRAASVPLPSASAAAAGPADPNDLPTPAPPSLTKKFQAALSKALQADEKPPLVHVSIDRDKAGGHVFAALGLGHAHDLGKRSLEEFHHLISHLVKQGFKLIVVQESCGFGYELHRTLAAMPGVEALIVHCQPLSGKRKTDRMDARQLCLRLQQFSSGNHDALRPIRVPTAEQVRARSEVTLRGQALGSIGRLQRQGWSLMQQHDVHDLPPRWWTRVAWPKVRKRLSQQPDHAWLLTMLEPIRAIIVQLRAWQLSIEGLLVPDANRCLAGDEASDAMDDDHSEKPAANPAAKREVATKPEGNAQKEPITAAPAKTTDIATPHGMGALTRAVLDRRIGDWHRFNNRKQVGSFIGACPGEYSSGGVQQQGGKIDRRGDPHLRAMMTELVWRLRKFQPQWRGFVKFAAILGPESKAGRPARKKAITACVRLLFIDLWRLFTGQLQASDIGLN